MTRHLTLQKLAVLSLVAAALVLPITTRSEAQAQSIGTGRLPNFQSTPNTLGRHVQGVVQGMYNRNPSYPQGHQRARHALPSQQQSCPNTRPVPSPRTPPVHPVHKPSQPAPTVEDQARVHVVAARGAFEKQDYQTALQRMDEAVKLVPENLDARQFRSLILFAMPDYRRAAAEAYDAILLGPVWNWATLHTLYPDTKVYTQQYHRLQQAAASQPDSLEVHFLLAYHYLMLGHLKHGEAELLKVLEIQPDEPVTVQLLQAVRAAQKSSETQTAQK